MKASIYLLFISFFPFTTESALYAQGDPVVQPLPRAELGLMGLGLGVELPVGQKSLLDLGAGMGGGYYRTSEDFNYTYTRSPVIYVNAGYRYLYNRQRMVLEGRNTLHNAGNFVGGKVKYASQSLFNPEENFGPGGHRLNNTVLVEGHWGIQRPLTKRFFYNFHVGVGYARDFDFGGGVIYPALGAKLAYNLFSEKY